MEHSSGALSALFKPIAAMTAPMSKALESAARYDLYKNLLGDDEASFALQLAKHNADETWDVLSASPEYREALAYELRRSYGLNTIEDDEKSLRLFKALQMGRAHVRLYGGKVYYAFLRWLPPKFTGREILEFLNRLGEQ